MLALFENSEIVFLMAVMLCLLVGSGFFSASETALFFLSGEEIQRFQKRDRPGERRVVALLHNPDRLLTAVLFWNLVINLSFFTCGVLISERLASDVGRTAAGGFGIVSLGLMIICGEVVPKSCAVMFRQPLSRTVSLPLAFAVRLFDPLSPGFAAITRSLRRVFWPDIRREHLLHPEDLEQAIDNTASNRDVIKQERLVLHNILDLSEIPIEEVMRPRGTYRAVRAPVHLEELADSPVPADYLVLLEEEGDDVVGAIPLSDFSILTKEHLEQAAEEVIHVPWCAPVAQVLQRLEDTQRSLASVVNEYGETIGVVTYEDIVDTILSAEPSRARRVLRRDPILSVAPDTWHIDGMTSLRYLCRRLSIDYSPDADSQVTLAGVFHEELERLPEVGDECDWNGFHFRIIDSRTRGHFRVLATKVPQEDENGEADES